MFNHLLGESEKKTPPKSGLCDSLGELSGEKNMDPNSSFDCKKEGIYAIFKEKLDEGYSEVAFGDGDWIGKRKITKIYVFYKKYSSGDLWEIKTYEYPAFRDNKNQIIELQPFENLYTNQKDFQKYLEQFKIQLRDKSLLKILKWDEFKDTKPASKPPIPKRTITRVDEY